MYEAKDVQSKADAFYQVINEGITSIFPIKTVRVHIRDKPWVTDRVKSLIAQRQKAFALGDRVARVVLRNNVIREINPKRAGLFGPISQPRGADSAPPPDLGNRSRKHQVRGTSG